MSNEANCTSEPHFMAESLRAKIRAFDIAICELEVGRYLGVSPAVHVLQGARDRCRKGLQAFEHGERARELEERPRLITIATVQQRVDQAECRDQGGRLLWSRHGSPRDVRREAEKRCRPQDSIRDETDDGAKAEGRLAKMSAGETAIAADEYMRDHGHRLPPELR